MMALEVARARRGGFGSGLYAEVDHDQGKRDHDQSHGAAVDRELVMKALPWLQTRGDARLLSPLVHGFSSTTGGGAPSIKSMASGEAEGRAEGRVVFAARDRPARGCAVFRRGDGSGPQRGSPCHR